YPGGAHGDRRRVVVGTRDGGVRGGEDRRGEGRRPGGSPSRAGRDSPRTSGHDHLTWQTEERAMKPVNILGIGPLKVAVDKEKSIPLPPIVGGLAVAAGVVILIVGARKS